MADLAIHVEDLGKQFRIGRPQGGYRTLRETITGALASPFRWVAQFPHRKRHDGEEPDNTIWALRNVSFDIQQGEVVGIIGTNGAGKSTLLKILSRVTEPSEGFAEMHGRLGSLLEVGIGFHPELTGRENIYLNGAIMGMKKSEVERRFDEIVIFSNVEQFIDTPVKHYSSGMYLRLAFAVAAHMDSEILLVDEVLSVGDARFQNKCLDKMGEVAKEGRTVLFVSHNLADITRLCPETILLEGGVIKAKGSTEEIVNLYLNSCFHNNLSSSPLRQGGGEKKRFVLTNVALLDKAGNPIKVLRNGQDFSVKLQYTTNGSLNLSQTWARLAFADASGNPLFVCHSLQSRPDILAIPSKGTLVCQVKKFPLLPGNYILGFAFFADGDVAPTSYEGIMRLQVVEGDFFGTGKLPSSRFGHFLVDHCWDVMD